MSDGAVILDTGPLVAFLWDSEPRHAWAIDIFHTLPPPLLTCEPVLTEAFYLLHRATKGAVRLMDFLETGGVLVDFAISGELDELSQLIKKYRDLPMSLADACLVRMVEQRPGAAVLTLDRHFSIYRQHGRQPIPTIMP